MPTEPGRPLGPAARIARETLTEGIKSIPLDSVLLAGLHAVGVVTGAGPIVSLVSHIGGKALADLSERAIDHFFSRWLGKSGEGALSGDIAGALSQAFAGAVLSLQTDWQASPAYARLRHYDPDEAGRTVTALAGLEEGAGGFLAGSKELAALVQSDKWVPVTSDRALEARQMLTAALANYLLGYNDTFVSFVQTRLPDEWIVRFGNVLKSDTPEGNRAWRAYQQLWQESLQDTLGQIARDTGETRQAAQWLREWAARLQSTPASLRDPTGEQELDAALAPIRRELDEIKAIAEETLRNTEEIKADVKDVQSEIKQLGADVRERPLVTITGAQVTQVYAEQAYKVSGLPNPYLGLRSFTYEDRALYAGREQTVAGAVAVLTAPGDQRTLLFVTGASGSGKSSFAQAGLLPALEQFYAVRGMQPRHAVFRPSRQPVARLADALMQLGLSSPDLLLDPAGKIGAPAAFASYLEHQTPAGQVNLLVIDQFEELFSQSSPDQRDMLFAILAALSPFARSRTHLIATMRSDYLPELFNMPALYELAKVGIDLRTMAVDELKAAIQRPLQVARPAGDKRWEPALVDRLAHDAAGDASYLPLLQVTLEEIWAGGSLTLDRYGTLTDAIRERAEAVYAYTTATAIRQAETVYTYTDHAGSMQQPRTPAEQAAIISIFLDLVEVSLDDDAHRDVRRPRSKAGLAGGDPQRSRLIDELLNARLLSASVETRMEDGIERPEEIIDIIHETLIGNWDRLRQAIAERRQALQQRVRFEHAVREWLANARSDDYLLSGVRLAEAQALDRRGDISLRDASARELLDRSAARQQAEQERELQEQRRRAEEAAHRARTLRSFLVATALLLVVAVGAAIFAFAEQTQAQQESNARATAVIEANTQANSRATAVAQAGAANVQLKQQLTVAQSQQLAFASLNESKVDAETGLLLGYEALARDHNNLSEQAVRDALDALPWQLTALVVTNTRQTGTSGFSDNVLSASFTGDGKRVLAVYADGHARLWDLQGNVLASFDTDGNAASASPDGRLIAASRADKTVGLWDDKGSPVAALTGHTGKITAAAFSPDGKLILTASEDGTARLWDTQGRQVAVLSGHTGKVNQASFSPDGKLVITASDDKTARVWDASGKPLLTLSGHAGGVLQALISPDGQHIVTVAQQDSSVRVWDMQGKVVATISDLLSTQYGQYWDYAAYNHDGTRLLLLRSGNDQALIFDAAGKRTGVAGYLSTERATFSPDGGQILTVDQNGEADEWTLPDSVHSTGQHVATLHSRGRGIGIAAFSPDGKRIVTGAGDGTVLVWTSAPTLLPTLNLDKSFFSSAAYSADGRYILTTSNDGIARLWENGGKLVAELPGGGSGPNSDSPEALFSPDDQHILTVYVGDGKAGLWDMQGKQLTTFGENLALNALYTADGKYIVDNTRDGKAVVYDASGRLVSVPALSGMNADSVELSPAGHIAAIVATQGDTTSCLLWDLDKGTTKTLLPNSASGVRPSWSPDGKYLAAITGDSSSVAVWDAGGQQVASFSTADDPQAVDISSDDRHVYLPGLMGTQLMDVKGRSPVELPLNGDPGVHLFSPDGRLLLTTASGDDDVAHLWDTSGKPVAALSGHTQQVMDAAFSPDNQLIATSSGDGTLRLWDRKGTLVSVLRGHGGGLAQVAFSPDGSRLLAVSSQGRVEQFLVRAQDLLAFAACRVRRGLAPDEIDAFKVGTPLFDFSGRNCPR